MKTINDLRPLLATIMFTTMCVFVHAQKPDAPPRYKDVVVDNPNAEADMKVLGDFVNALAAGDPAKLKSLMGDKFMMYGPSAADSSNAEQYVKGWVEGGFKNSTDRKVGFVTQTFKVLKGDLAGAWVSQWGDYTFTQEGKTIKVPFQCTARIADGKIANARIYFDNTYILKQLGYKVTPPETMSKN